METKYIILMILILAGLAVWLLPRARFASSLSFTERGYVALHWTGILCGLAGIVVTLLRPDDILDTHLYELLLLPVLAAYAVYPAIVSRVQKKDDLLDEKQTWDTTRAAALSLTATSMTMFAVYLLYRQGALTDLVWFPLFMFSVVGWYSAGTLYFHRTA